MTKNISGGVVHTVPADLREALTADSEALSLWENLTPLARNEWICWVTFVKKEETRNEHIVRLVNELKEGKRRPCCWIGCIHRTDKPISSSVKYVLSKQHKGIVNQQKKLLFEIANSLLLEEPIAFEMLSLQDEQFSIEVQKKFQDEIIKLYQESEFRKNARSLSSQEQILDYLSKIATGVSNGPVGYLPKLYKNSPSNELECTLASAFLKLAFDEQGIKNVRTCFLKGHQVTIQILENGSIKMFDAASTHTVEGIKHGFSHVFSADEVVEKRAVKDRPDEQDAFTFEIQTHKTPQQLESEILDQHGKIYKKKFYAHDPHILISLSVILDNLDDEKLKLKMPVLKELHYNEMKKIFNLLDKDTYLNKKRIV